MRGMRRTGADRVRRVVIPGPRTATRRSGKPRDGGAERRDRVVPDLKSHSGAPLRPGAAPADGRGLRLRRRNLRHPIPRCATTSRGARTAGTSYSRRRIDQRLVDMRGARSCSRSGRSTLRRDRDAEASPRRRTQSAPFLRQEDQSRSPRSRSHRRQDAPFASRWAEGSSNRSPTSSIARPCATSHASGPAHAPADRRGVLVGGPRGYRTCARGWRINSDGRRGSISPGTRRSRRAARRSRRGQRHRQEKTTAARRRRHAPFPSAQTMPCRAAAAQSWARAGSRSRYRKSPPARGQPRQQAGRADRRGHGPPPPPARRCCSRPRAALRGHVGGWWRSIARRPGPVEQTGV